MVLVNWPLKKNWPRGNSFPTCGNLLYRYSPPMRSECFPMIQEKLSTPWKTLSLIWNGLLVALPKLVRLLLKLDVGNAPGILVRDLDRVRRSRVHVLDTRQLLGDIVE